MSEKNIKKEERTLGLFDVFSLGFGGAIGSGIFVLLGLAIGQAGKSVVLSILLGVVVMTLAYFFHIIMSSMFSLSGGDYSFKSISMSPFFTGLSAYITFISGLAVAMYALGAVDYARIVFPWIGEHGKLVAFVITTLFFLSTYKGSNFASKVNSVMTVVLLIAIVTFIIRGIPKVQSGYFSDPNFFYNGTKGMITGMVLMGWACQGTTMAPVAIQAVTKDSKKTIPKAIGLVALAIAVVYSLMAIVAAGVLPIEEVGGENLSVVASEIFSRPVFVIFIIGGAVFAILTSMMSLITVQRYPMLNIANDGWLPNIFKRTNKNGYPYVIYVFYYIISLLPIIFGLNLDVIVSMTMIPSMILNTYMNFACIRVIEENPIQWERSSLHMNKTVMKIICVIAGLCSAFVGLQLLMGLEGNDLIAMICLLIIIALLSAFNLKSGRVNKQDIIDRKTRILQEAYAEEKLVFEPK